MSVTPLGPSLEVPARYCIQAESGTTVSWHMLYRLPGCDGVAARVHGRSCRYAAAAAV